MNNKFLKYLIIMFVAFFNVKDVAAFEKIGSLEGYNVILDYEGHPRERDIAFKFYKKHYASYGELGPNDIGIALFNINSDNEVEIIAFFNNSKCEKSGCLFDILKKKTDDKGGEIYRRLRWNNPKELIAVKQTVKNTIKILNSTSQGFHNLLLDDKILLKWNGEYYEVTNVLSKATLNNLQNKQALR